MFHRQDTQQSDSLNLDWLVSNLRWLWLFLAALFVLAENYLSDALSPNFNQLLIVLGIAFGLNALYAGLLWASFFPSVLAVFALIGDVAFAIALLYFMSDHTQLLLPLMVFPVVIAGVRFSVETGVIAALPIIAVYGAALLPYFQSEIDFARPRVIRDFLGFGVNALTLLLSGTLPGFFVGQRFKFIDNENSRELKRLRTANEQAKLLSEMATMLSSTLDYRKVLRTTVDSAYEALSKTAGEDEATVGVVLLFEGDDGQLTIAAGRNISRNVQGRKISAEEGLVGKTINTAETTVTYRANEDKVLTALAPRSKSAICAPLRAGLSTYGAILFCSTKLNHYKEEHKVLLTTFCSQAIIALQNAQLFDDVQHEQERILEKEAEARRKLARDLHDGPTQSIAAIAMRLNFIKMLVQNNEIDKAHDELIRVEEIAHNTTKEIRTMLFAMRPVILETQGLIAALEQYANRLNETEDFRVTINQRNYESKLDKEAEGVVFAIVEEAIGNAKKHSEASEIKINVVGGETSLFVEVRDNGVGFDVAATKASYDQRTSLGLINMDERARLVGGQCTLESALGRGTAIRIEIPYQRVKEAA
ncbi:MAG TPA: GAF domain-containing sensor histidine kinase [Anaerolineae bacterium]|nr:GAF domain-containing sensor histidine kinase [Anaerolineae bacterium]HMR63271.1 GAF domain-containing sensor histidine kinase [Anaerolineae bacterium]